MLFRSSRLIVARFILLSFRLVVVSFFMVLQYPNRLGYARTIFNYFCPVLLGFLSISTEAQHGDSANRANALSLILDVGLLEDLPVNLVLEFRSADAVLFPFLPLHPAVIVTGFRDAAGYVHD